MLTVAKRYCLVPNTVPKTRDEAVRKYLDGSAGTTAEQCVALTRLCEDMEHIGYQRGIIAGGIAAREGAALAIMAVVGVRNG